VIVVKMMHRYHENRRLVGKRACLLRDALGSMTQL